MNTFHELESEPSAWMVEGLGAATPALGVQVRVRVASDGLDVGMFTNGANVTDDEREAVRAVLTRWKPNRRTGSRGGRG